MEPDMMHKPLVCTGKVLIINGFTAMGSMVDIFLVCYYSVFVKSNRSKVPLEQQREAVRTYLKGEKSLRKIAQEFGVPYTTLYAWVEQHRKRKKGFPTKRHFKRLPQDMEQRVMLLKEQHPFMTVREAQKVLNEQGKKISQYGIWSIWKRFGLTAKSIRDPFNTFCEATPESRESLTRARMYLQKGDSKSAAKIINSVPCMHDDPILKELPPELLSPRRKLDQLTLEFGQMPLPEYQKHARRIGRMLEKNGLILSSIIANIHEIMVLGWMSKTNEQSKLLRTLQKKLRNTKSSVLKFIFCFQKATCHFNLLEVNEALEYVRKCRRIIPLLTEPYYKDMFAGLLTFLGNYKEAAHIYQKTFYREKGLRAEQVSLKLVLCGPLMAGNYREARRIISKVQHFGNSTMLGAGYRMADAQLSFGSGNLTQAFHLLLEALKRATKGQLNNRIYGTTIGLAGVAMALNRKQEALLHLRKYQPLMKKVGSLKEVLVLKHLAGTDEQLTKDYLRIQPFRLLSLLKNAQRTMRITDYHKAYNFAARHALLGLFHRWIVFFPDPVLKLLERGKSTGLPKELLKWPIFQQNMPVYHVGYLGDMYITRRERRIRVKLSPLEAAFLIYCTHKAATPGSSIILNELYENFWPRSENPRTQLLHLLSAIKKKIRLPDHLLAISSSYPARRLVNRGFYMTSDYNDFSAFLIQINSLERAEEWGFARRDYLRAFKLIRGKPFEKMYDSWSEQMRGVILNKVEQAAIQYTKMCVEERFPADIKKTITKVSEVLPQSEELRTLLKSL
jgi:transposase-like protein